MWGPAEHSLDHTREVSPTPGPPSLRSQPPALAMGLGEREEDPRLDMALGFMGRGALHSRENGLNSWAHWLLLFQISWRNLMSSHSKQTRSYHIFYHILTGSLSLSVKIFTSLSLSLNCFSIIFNNKRISCVWRSSVVLHKSV